MTGLTYANRTMLTPRADTLGRAQTTPLSPSTTGPKRGIPAALPASFLYEDLYASAGTGVGAVLRSS